MCAILYRKYRIVPISARPERVRGNETGAEAANPCRTTGAAVPGWEGYNADNRMIVASQNPRQGTIGVLPAEPYDLSGDVLNDGAHGNASSHYTLTTTQPVVDRPNED
jgi:hypothetical protein